MGAWKAAYLSEIARIGEQTQGRVLSSVFFGGGTPSLMSADLVAAILDKIRATWPLANDVEITLEANPTSVEATRFAAYRDSGVTRLSMGVQALEDAALRQLGRLHSAAEAIQAFDIARKIFPRLSFDLIYARQFQTPEDWRSELTRALDLGIDHLSAYQLTIEDGTAFGARHAIGKLGGLPDDDRAAQMYEITQELCDKAGLPAYEISNHAADLAQSRHNLIYWRSGDYAGIGPGAHGRLTLDDGRMATSTPLGPSAWLAQVSSLGHGENPREALTPEDHAKEMVMMGLRLADGISLSRLGQIDPDAISMEKRHELADLGLISVTGDCLKVTPKGRPILNAILRELLT